jgi:hypothetical protein
MMIASEQPHLPLQRLLLGHGALVLLLGFVFGFGFLFFLLQRVELWPIPGQLDIQLPGTIKAWRMSHLEGVMNGFALWLLAAILPLLPVPGRVLKQIVLASIVTAWVFPIASVMDALFPDSRGLAFGGPVTNLLAFFLFYIGVLAIIWVAAAIAYYCLWRRAPN